MTRRLPIVGKTALPETPLAFRPDQVVSDAQGRKYSYVRLSVTDRCDFGCVYCMPPAGEIDHALRPELLTFEEMARLADVFHRAGFVRLRFTGGEPLVRKDMLRLVELVHQKAPALELAMTTNASRMAELARPLFQAGLKSINVSLDSLRADRFSEITRGGDLGRVKAGIRAALDVGMTVKLNVVPLLGLNDDEFVDIVQWAWGLGITPRFIELMPLGEGARIANARYLAADDVQARLSAFLESGKPQDSEMGARGPARYVTSRDGQNKVGFITAVSAHFCDTCNRIRITAKGDIRACLASRRALSLRDLIRSGKSDRDLLWALHWSLSGKDPGHYFLDEQIEEHHQVGMSLIGG